jgi:hypothetical protein
MADIEYSDDTGPRQAQAVPDPVSRGGLVTAVGALTSLLLVIGVGYWGYRLLVRDVSGVPVVRALEGPMRGMPRDPGGEPADYQGLAVNEVAAQGAAAPTADRLILAPRPVELADEDQPAEPAAATTAAEYPAEPGTDALTTQDAVNALVEQLTAGVAPMAGDDPALLPGTVDDGGIIQPEPLGMVADDDDALRPEAAAQDAPGLKQSPRPKPRPARSVALASAGDDAITLALTDDAGASASVGAGVDVDPDSLPVGTLMAQLGAYDSPQVARAEWDRFQTRFAVYLEGKQRVIQQANSGGRTFFRLRALGFDDMSDARRFCSALVAERADCIPVVLR